MSDEAEFKTKLVTQCRKMGAYARRFEDRYAVGILDIVVAFSNSPVCFIEAKIIRTATAFGPTERQWVEGDKIIKLGGGHAIPVLVGWTPEGLMYVGEWTRRLPLKACYRQEKGDDYAATLWRYVRDHNKSTRRMDPGRSQEGGVPGT